ncbi:hypothetical protein H8A92_28975 [Bradyrhizobium sp. 10BB]|nr:hypothetical protein [Bradyrhizobium acaciae]
MTAHRQAETASAADSRAGTGIRRIDQGAAWAGCACGAWLCPWGWAWP